MVLLVDFADLPFSVSIVFCVLLVYQCQALFVQLMHAFNLPYKCMYILC